MRTTKIFLAMMLMLGISACEQKEEEEPKVVGPLFILGDATVITSNSAFISATISGDDVVETGFLRGNSAALNQSSFKITLGFSSGTISHSLTGLQSETAVYYSAYAKNAAGDFFQSSVKSFVTLEEQTTLSLGDVYEGGIIYYLDVSGEHGLLVSPVDVTQATNWQTAVDNCNSYSLMGNSNWRLPDLDELEFLYERKQFAGTFAPIAYWSSSVEGSNPNLAYGVYFGGGTNAGKSFVYNKTDGFQHSRAIRDF